MFSFVKSCVGNFLLQLYIYIWYSTSTMEIFLFVIATNLSSIYTNEFRVFFFTISLDDICIIYRYIRMPLVTFLNRISLFFIFFQTLYQDSRVL